MKKKLIKNILKKIEDLAKKINRKVLLMECCGTHTQTVVRYGIRKLIPRNIKLVTGPGCPVCITSQEDIDAVVNLALVGIPIATYGDVLKVPGFYGSLDQAREKGAWVREVYSLEEAFDFLKEKPDLVFFGIGFETTAPITAIAIKRGLTVYSAHRLFLPAMSALLKIPGLKIDGFICPGHVSTITGSLPYQRIKASQVISGFEPEDVLISIYLLLKQISENRKVVENEYTRSVKPEGNKKAYNSIFEVFDIVDANWRGFGILKKSGLEIKKKFSKFNAKIKYKKILEKIDPVKSQQTLALTQGKQASNGVDFSKSKLTYGCSCAEIILGKKEPKECTLFKKICTPENPKGPCMVSVEGACYNEFIYSK